jgi:hypothetical protein
MSGTSDVLTSWTREFGIWDVVLCSLDMLAYQIMHAKDLHLIKIMYPYQSEGSQFGQIRDEQRQSSLWTD